MKHTINIRIEVPAFAQIEVEANTMHEALRFVETQIEEHGLAAPELSSVAFDVDWSGYDTTSYVVTEGDPKQNPSQLELWK
jgi:hypothetical protein